MSTKNPPFSGSVAAYPNVSVAPKSVNLNLDKLKRIKINPAPFKLDASQIPSQCNLVGAHGLKLGLVVYQF
jgi:hypothetical protein